MEKKKQFRIIDKPFSKKKAIIKGIYSENCEVMCVRFDQQDTMVAIGCANGIIKLYNLNTSNKISQLSTNYAKQETPVTSVRWRPSNQNLNQSNSIILGTNGSGNIVQYVAKTGKKIFQKKEEDNYIFALDYNLKGDKFATAGKDCIIRIYDEQTKTVSNQLYGVTWHKAGHNNRLFGLKFNPDDPNIILSGGWDQNVHIWDIRNGSSVGTICGPKICADTIDVKGDHILTGAHRGSDQLQLWDFSSQKLIKSFTWQQYQKQTSGFIYGCQFNKLNPDSIVAAGGNSVKIFSTKQDYKELIEVKLGDHNTIYSLDFGNYSNKLVFGGKDGHSYYLNISSQTE